MTNLIIGLCFGLAACVVLMILWNIASGLRERMNAPESEAELNGGLRADMRSQSYD